MEASYNASYGNNSSARSTGVAASQGYTVEEPEEIQSQGKMVTGQVATPIVHIASDIYGARVAMVNGQKKHHENLCLRTERKLENDNRASVCNKIAFALLIACAGLVYQKIGEFSHCNKYDDPTENFQCNYGALASVITRVAPFALGFLAAKLCGGYFKTNASNIGEVAKASTMGDESITLKVMEGSTCKKAIAEHRSMMQSMIAFTTERE